MLGPHDFYLCCGTVRQADFRRFVEATAANGNKAILVRMGTQRLACPCLALSWNNRQYDLRRV
jgi:hypothetical protein